MRDVALIVGQALLWVLPWSIRRAVLSGILGYSLDKSARIGFSIVLAHAVEMAPNARIGHFTIIRRLGKLSMAESSYIGHLNWISGTGPDTPFFTTEVGRLSELRLGAHAAITQGHRIDTANTVVIGAFSILAGSGSQILTHSVDVRTNKQVSGVVEVGPYCFIGTKCVLVKGSRLPGFCVLGAGSVLAHRLEETHCLYSGVPAVRIHKLPSSYAYFQRKTGYVD